MKKYYKKYVRSWIYRVFIGILKTINLVPLGDEQERTMKQGE